MGGEGEGTQGGETLGTEAMKGNMDGGRRKEKRRKKESEENRRITIDRKIIRKQRQANTHTHTHTHTHTPTTKQQKEGERQGTNRKQRDQVTKEKFIQAKRLME